ncbi:MAG TPA: PepSY domain-containing protein [Luteimonas sp.]|nr:PepSY domain-containing protein [Luteimonas sp.]
MNIRNNLVAAAVLFASAGVGFVHAGEPSQASLMAQTKITQAAAEKIALAKVPSGMVKSAELEQEHGALVWSFDIATPKSSNIHEILVNAKTGKIVHTEIETPKAQAKETAADKLEKKSKP